MQEIINGYCAEKVEDLHDSGIAYLVYGPKAEYKMYRNKPNPSMLFVTRTNGGVCKLCGYAWFTDKSGIV